MNMNGRKINSLKFFCEFIAKIMLLGVFSNVNQKAIGFDCFSKLVFEHEKRQPKTQLR